MAVLQCLKVAKIPPTFKQLAQMILEMIVKIMLLYNSNRVDFVTDSYPDLSIKNCERNRRAAAGYQRIKIFSGDQKTPTQWKKFLNCGSKKEALVEFLFKSWCQAILSVTTLEVHLFIAHGAFSHQLCHAMATGHFLQYVQFQSGPAVTRKQTHGCFSTHIMLLYLDGQT